MRLREPQEATGAPWAAQQYAARHGATAILGPISFAMPAGPTVRHAYETLRDEVLEALKAALPVDVVAYSLHGAMIAEGYDDCEGDILARTRALVGPNVAVGALLDLHCHLSAAMIGERRRHRDLQGIPAHRFRGARRGAGRAAGAHGAAGDPPHMAVHDCRMIDLFHTTQEPMQGFVADMQAREGRDGVLSSRRPTAFPGAMRRTWARRCSSSPMASPTRGAAGVRVR